MYRRVCFLLPVGYTTCDAGLYAVYGRAHSSWLQDASLLCRLHARSRSRLRGRGYQRLYSGGIGQHCSRHRLRYLGRQEVVLATQPN